MKNTNGRFPLKMKATVLIILFSLILCTTAIIMSFTTFSRTNDDIFKNQARDLAYTAVSSIDGDALRKVKDDVLAVYLSIPQDELVTSDDWGSPEFDAYLERYSDVQESPEFKAVYSKLDELQNNDIAVLSSIYTLFYDTTYDEPLAVYLVDPSEEDPCLPGVIDTFNPEDDFDAVKAPNNGIRSYITKTDEYGWLVVAGAPVYDSDDNFVAFLAVDLSMDKIKSKEDHFLMSLTMILLASAAVQYIIMMLTVDAVIIKPLKKLSRLAVDFVKGADSERIAAFEALDIKRGDEIGDLSDAMKQMERDLNIYIRDLTVVTAEKERLGAELNVAAQIQTGMLPTRFPKCDAYTLFASMTPAKEVGGDFYDYFPIDDDRIAIVMADVSGKGVPAALFMVIAKSVIHNIIMVGGPLSEITGVINRILCENDISGYFVTAWIGILTLSTGELDYVNAGHEYPAIRRSGGMYELIETENFPPLCADDEMVFEETSIKLEKGDSIFLYTDGVPDAKSESGDRFGTKRMTDTLNANRDCDPETLLSRMKAEVDAFMGSADVFDDITMLCLYYKGGE